ncbi:MAG: M4 family metallopeptidase [Acidobacteriota bacterium]|nr:M4 family metallopeptidase [Acidobacteriota bacterium]
MRLLTRLLTATCVVAVIASELLFAQDPRRHELLTFSVGTGDPLFDLRQAETTLNQLHRDGTLLLLQTTADPLVPSRTHERFRQYHEGVPIFGAEVTRQTTNGTVVSVFGKLHLTVTLNTTPALSPETVVQTIEDLTGQPARVLTFPTLVVLPNRGGRGGYRLVYEVRVFSGSQLMAYFIDAVNGEVALAFNDLKTQQPTFPCSQCVIGAGVGVHSDQKKMSVTAVGGNFLAYDQLRPADLYTFDMRGDSVRTLEVLAGIAPLFDADLATDGDNQWLDGATVDAHVGVGWTYDYLYRRFGRQGLNDLNVRMVSLVHPIDRADFSTASSQLISLFNLNSFYCGLCGPDGVGVTVFGEGLPPHLRLDAQQVNFLAGALDIVAHELAHGVTDFTSSLLYLDESGALNEAFSDIIGVGAEHYAEPLRQFKGGKAANYLIGEDVFVPGGLRSLENPVLFGDPDHYSLRFLGTADNGGVHTNALIVGHAYYLAIEGGTNRVSGVKVHGVGAANREQIEQVFYRAFTLLLTRESDFSAAKVATIQSARDLFGLGSTAEHAVSQAWIAVGVN